jgi:hypothetical protein
MNRNHKDIFLAATVYFVLGIGASMCAAQPLAVDVSVDKTTLSVNQQLMLTIDLSGEGAQSVQPPELPNVDEFLDFLSAGGSSQNIQIINGKMSITRSLSYYYLAKKEGQFTIPAVEVLYKGNSYRSKPIQITVVGQAQQQPLQSPPEQTPPDQVAASDDELFVRAIVDKHTIYQNEPVLVTYRIYTQVAVASYSITKAPDTADFWAEEFEMQGQPQTREEVINGRKYVVADLKKTALFPASPGSKEIGPITLTCDVRQQRSRRSRDIFDSFFDDPFFNPTVKKTISSLPVKLTVQPLPAENRPPSFSGAVGDYNLSASLDKTNVTTNEAITLKIRISGTGNINLLPNPNVVIPSDFEQYEPKVTQSIARSGGVISGEKTYEYVLVPRFPGQQKIKPVMFSFFDPKKKTYKTLSSPPFEVNVAKGAEDQIAVGGGLSKEEVRLVGQDIRFIKLSSSNLRQKGKEFYNSYLFAISVVFPLLAVAFAFGYTKRQEQLAGNRAYAKSRRANRLAQKQLSKARALQNEKTQKEFYAEISGALAGFAANKLDLEAAGIISDELGQLLRKRNLDNNLIENYIDLIRTCDYQRFAPVSRGTEEMSSFYQKAKQAIIQLEKAL